MAGNCGVVIGSALWDFSLTADRLPEPGDTVLCGPVLRSPGGKGLNQAVALKRLGADVQFLSAVGADQLGVELRRYCVGQGLSDYTIYEISEIPTGVGVPINIPSVGKFGFASIGAALHLPAKAVSWFRENLNSIQWIACHFETSKDVLSTILRIAREGRKKIYINAAPKNDVFTDLVSTADVLIVNVAEAQWLLRQTLRPPNVTDAVADKLRKQFGVETVVVTLGAHGVVWATANSVGSAPAVDLEVLDPIGAGDAFCAGLVHAVEVQGAAFAEAIGFASHCAALATSAVGAAEAMPSLTAVVGLQKLRQDIVQK